MWPVKVVLPNRGGDKKQGGGKIKTSAPVALSRALPRTQGVPRKDENTTLS